MLRDSGCSTVVVKRDVVKDEQLLESTQKCVLLDGTARNVPVARIQIDSPYFVGTVNALCMTNPLYDLILGNIAGVKDPRDPDPNWSPLTKCVNQNHEESQILPNEVTAVVETRAQKLRKAKDLRPLRVPEAENLSESREEIVTAQHEDPALDKLWTLAEKGQRRKTGKGNESRYVVSDELLFREFTSPTVENGRVLKQLVLPKKLHSKVLKIAHDSSMAGHLGIKKTADRVLANFYWPGVEGDIRRYCVSCDICQRTIAKGHVRKVPLGRMPLIDTPFRRVAVDLVGPIHPVTERGNKYILTLVDYATRYPEAVALPKIETERVAEALFEIFTRMGVPHEILSDMGTQFTSDLMKEIGKSNS